MNFDSLVNGITDIGVEWHKDRIVANSSNNVSHIEKTVKDLSRLDGDKANSAIVISAGPSLHYNDSLKLLASSDYKGSIIAIDGSYVKCLKAGVIPDYVITLDPHPTRIVRWFGDPEFEKNLEGDNYFSRQDLDIDFRENSLRQNRENIALINECASRTKLIIASTAPANLVERAEVAGFDMYWWTPLVDNPNSEGSLTRKMYDLTKLPAINTGGNVGTAAWVFAQFWLKINKIAVIGMDLGYRQDLPYNMTQGYPELVQMLGEENITSDLFPVIENPDTGNVLYTDPTYYWYRKNTLDLIASSGATLYNCTGGGILFGEGVVSMGLRQFLADYG